MCDILGFFKFTRNDTCLASLNILWSHNPSRWRHNGRDGVSNHQPHHCLFNRLFRRRSKQATKVRVTSLCVRGIPPQMASNAENVSIWWRHHAISCSEWRSNFITHFIMLGLKSNYTVNGATGGICYLVFTPWGGIYYLAFKPPSFNHYRAMLFSSVEHVRGNIPAELVKYWFGTLYRELRM